METSANYYRVEELSDEEKKKLYMGMDKEAIVDMLIECNKIIANISKLIVTEENPIRTITETKCRGWYNCGNYATSVCTGLTSNVCPCSNWSGQYATRSNNSKSCHSVAKCTTTCDKCNLYY